MNGIEAPDVAVQRCTGCGHAIQKAFWSRLALVERVVRNQIRITPKPLAVGLPTLVRRPVGVPVIKLLRPNKRRGICGYFRDITGSNHSSRTPAVIKLAGAEGEPVVETSETVPRKV